MDGIEDNLSLNNDFSNRHKNYQADQNTEARSEQAHNDGNEPLCPRQERRISQRITGLFSRKLGVTQSRSEILEPPGGRNHKCKYACFDEGCQGWDARVIPTTNE